MSMCNFTKAKAYLFQPHSINTLTSKLSLHSTCWFCFKSYKCLEILNNFWTSMLKPIYDILCHTHINLLTYPLIQQICFCFFTHCMLGTVPGAEGLRREWNQVSVRKLTFWSGVDRLWKIMYIIICIIIIYMFIHMSHVCLVNRSHPTTCDPMDCNPPGSSVHGILQARTLEWVAMPSSRGSSQPKNWTQISHIAGGFFTIWATREALVSMYIILSLYVCLYISCEVEVAQSCPTLCNPMDYSLPGSSVHGILQARVLEWVAISFSRGSSLPRDWTRVSRIVGRHFNRWEGKPGDIWHTYLYMGVKVCMYVCIYVITYQPNFWFVATGRTLKF